MKRNMLDSGLIAGVAVIGTLAWTTTTRAGYPAFHTDWILAIEFSRSSDSD